VRLVVQIKTVGDELFQFNINGSVKRPSTAAEVGTTAFAALSSITATRTTFAARTAFTTRATTAALRTIAAIATTLVLGWPGALTTWAFTFFRTRASVALWTRLGCRRRGLLLYGLRRLGRFGSFFEIFHYGFHFFWHCFPFVTRQTVSPILAPRGLPVAT
jgi:hypothetical protein